MSVQRILFTVPSTNMSDLRKSSLVNRQRSQKNNLVVYMLLSMLSKA